MIPLNLVDSSALKGWGYDAGSQTLAVQLKNGDVWHYRNVPAEIAQGFESCESVGRYYATTIMGAFESEKQCPDPQLRTTGLPVILEDLDAACKAAMTTVRRSIGQHARHAHAEIRALVKAAEQRLDIENPPAIPVRVVHFSLHHYAGEA